MGSAHLIVRGDSMYEIGRILDQGCLHLQIEVADPEFLGAGHTNQ
ncbi:MAG: hypothetical protein VX589_04330 [Myxococcota bacterium]|nr:hypothetical protein [Myxococcota bacterium]